MVAVNTRKIKRKLNLQNKFYLYVPTSFSFLSLSLSLSLIYHFIEMPSYTYREQQGRENESQTCLVAFYGKFQSVRVLKRTFGKIGGN